MSNPMLDLDRPEALEMAADAYAREISGLQVEADLAELLAESRAEHDAWLAEIHGSPAAWAAQDAYMDSVDSPF